MPREFRNIYFTENELKIALMQFSARKKVIFKVDNINEINIQTENPISVALKVFDVESNQLGAIKYSNAEVAAALMGYCMYLKIPLPKNGKNKVVLFVWTGLQLI